MVKNIEIRDHFLNDIRFTAEIDVRPDTSYGQLIRAALLQGLERGADLRGADLRGADLEIDSAIFDDVSLKPFKKDYLKVLSKAQDEIPSLIKALTEGKIDGSVYRGPCACLVGTLEKAGASTLEHDPYRPIERWFFAITPGDTPDKNTVGGFRAAKALEWALEYCQQNGIDK